GANLGRRRLGTVMIAQAALVAPQALGEMVGRRIEGDIGRLGVGRALHVDAATDMNADMCAVEMGLARQHNRGFDRIAEVFAEDTLEAGRDMRLEGIADVEMLAFYGELHWLTGPDGHMGEKIAGWLSKAKSPAPGRGRGNIWSAMGRVKRPSPTVFFLHLCGLNASAMPAPAGAAMTRVFARIPGT